MLAEQTYAGSFRGYKLFHSATARIWTALTPRSTTPISGTYPEVMHTLKQRVASTPHARIGSHRGVVLYEREDGVFEAFDEYTGLWLSSSSSGHLRWLVDRYLDHGVIP